MKISRNTHEAASRGRSMSRPNSATQRIKDYFSVRLPGRPATSSSRIGDDREAMIVPDPVSMRRRASEPQVGSEPGICTFLMQERKELKRKQREKQLYETSQRRMDRANLKADTQSWDEKVKSHRWGRRGYGKLQEVSPTTDVKNGPNLRRVSKFEDLRAGDVEEADKRAKSQGDADIYRMKVHRQLIREGNLEKVVPPPSLSHKPEIPPKRRNLSANRKGHAKSESTSSKLSSYMETTADALDTTRRDLTANLRKSAEKAEKVITNKFDQLGRYSAGHGNNWDDVSDSDESFYCVGERRLSELDKARRISGHGTDPWIDGQQKECRLCQKPSPAGVRGLCRQCENEFRRAKTMILDDEENEVKPPPPLKIRRAKLASVSKRVVKSDEVDEVKPPTPLTIRKSKTVAKNAVDRIHSFPSGESNLIPKIQQVDRKPKILAQTKHMSQQACIDDGWETECISKYERWQPPDLRAQYKSQGKENSRWSPRLLGDEHRFSPVPTLLSKFNNAWVSSRGDENTAPLVVKDHSQNAKAKTTKSTSEIGCPDCYWEEL